jgi:Predicted flavoprotein
MHDGYLFTLGICGTASSASIAPNLLTAMMKAIRPVKRVAHLGDIRPLQSDGSLTKDSFLEEVVDDIPDAEALLIVTPLLHGGLPPRLQALLACASERLEANAFSDMLAGLVCVGGDAGEREAAESAVRRWCDQHQIGLLDVVALPDAPLDPAVQEPALELARRVYDGASQRLRARGIEHAR